MRPRFFAWPAWPACAAIAAGVVAATDRAHAAEPPPPHGVAVLAAPGAEPAAWPLAKDVYAKDALRPRFDEAHARVLAGEAAPAPSGELRDLADERAGVHGDDGASRALLKAIATQLGVRAILVVLPGGEPASARIYLADTGAFDAARYAPDAPAPASDGGVSPARWTGTVASLERGFAEPAAAGSPPEPLRAPALATSEPPPPKKDETKDDGKPFYASPWFWGAVGAAAFGGTAVYFATRDNSPSTIHLQLQVR